MTDDSHIYFHYSHSTDAAHTLFLNGSLHPVFVTNSGEDTLALRHRRLVELRDVPMP